MVCLYTVMILSPNKWQYSRDVLSCVCVRVRVCVRWPGAADNEFVFEMNGML